MLTLALPAALAALVALGPVVLFYFLRMRFRRQPVSSTLLWRRLVKSNEGGARLRWKSLLLLLLQALAVVTLVVLVGDPQWRGGASAEPGILYLVDTSASMGALEAGGSRWDNAVAAVRADSLAHPGSRWAVAASSVRVVSSPEDLTSSLRALRPSGVWDMGAAVARADAWVQTHAGTWTVVLVSDGAAGADAVEAAFRGRWRSLAFARPAPNVGITDLRLEGESGLRVKATLFNGYEAPRPLTIELAKDGRMVDRHETTAAVGRSVAEWTVESLAAAPGVWRADLGNQNDGLGGDDSIEFSLNRPYRARVLHTGPPDGFLKAAFGGVDWQEGTVPGTQRWDLVIASGDPPSWKGNLLTLGPPEVGGPVFLGPVVSGTARESEGAPALGRWVPWGDLVVRGARGLGVKPGATVLAEVEDWPVAVAWVDDAHHLALGVDPAHSNLGLTAVLPVLMANFRHEIVPQEANPLVDNPTVGQSVLRAGGDDWRIGTGFTAVRRGTLWQVTATQSGTATWHDGNLSGTMSAHLPAAESDTAPRVLRSPASEGAPAVGTWVDTLSLKFLVALVALAVLLLEWRLWNGSLSMTTARGVLRLVTAAAVVLAGAGLVVGLPTQNRSVAVLLDTSASLGPELVAQERQAALAYVGRLGPEDRVAVVAFAARPLVVAPFQARDAALASLKTVPLASDGAATDVAAAVSAGAALLEAESGARSQLLISDGRATAGGPAGDTGTRQGFPVSTVPIGRTGGGVAGRALDLPPSARPGQAVSVTWKGTSDRARRITLSLSVDGRGIGSRVVDLHEGVNEQSFVWTAGDEGVHRVDVVATADGATLSGAQASGLLDVGNRRSVLIARGPHTAGALAAALRQQGLPVTVTTAAGLPERVEGLVDTSVVVLDNVPAASLSAGQQARLAEWVSAGGGLLVVGGDSSLGRGEYFASALEDLLPVQTDTRQRLQFTRSRVLFVVDHSGSMSEDVGHTTKLNAALRGIRGALDSLNVQDEVGLLQFDTSTNWVLPFTPMAQKQTVLDALGRFNQGGGTDLTTALTDIVSSLGPPGPVKRHVILMTDGQASVDAAFLKDFGDRLSAADVSMTVLGIGDDVNEPLLASLAERTGGVYYRAQGEDLPALLHDETVRVTRDLMVEGTFQPRAVGGDPVHDLGEVPPVVGGYLATRTKPVGRLVWVIDRPDGADPLYAVARYGAGQVGVFTSDSGARWLSAWSGRPAYNRLWGQLVRSLEPASRDSGLRVTMAAASAVGKVVVEAVDETGRLRTGAALAALQGDKTVALSEVAPGRYEASLDLPEGLQVVPIVDTTGPLRTWTWAWNPSGAELAATGIDWTALGTLASSTGGRLEPLADPRPPAPRWAWQPVDLRLVSGLAALILLLFELGWRSLSLGQGAQAWAELRVWWAAQKLPWQPRVAPTPANTAEREKRVRDAYRYLASRRPDVNSPPPE